MGPDLIVTYKGDQFTATEFAKGLRKDIQYRGRLHKQLKHWDKKLYNLDSELLYYVMHRAESILDYRAEEERQESVIGKGI